MQEGNYDLEGKMRNPNVLLYLTEWIAHGTGMVPIEKATEKKYLKLLLYFHISHAIDSLAVLLIVDRLIHSC